MHIFGHRWIRNRDFKKVFTKDDIKKTDSNDIVLLEPLSDSIELAQYCQDNSIPFAVTVGSTKDAIFANALKALFIICQIEDATMIQPIAQSYLFDTRILVLITSEREIEKMAQLSIDGVIFPEAISLS